MNRYQTILILILSALIFANFILGMETALHYDTIQTNLSTDCPSYTVVNGQYVCAD